jgi:quinol monooxygenase YgiN
MTQQKPSVLIRFKPADGQKQALIDHLVATANHLATKEDGTEIFVVSSTPIDEDAVYVYEVYSSNEAKKMHESSEAYNIARQETSKLTDGIPQVIPLIPQGGKGLK